MKQFLTILTLFISSFAIGQATMRTPGTNTVWDGKLITVQSFAIPKTTLGGNLNGGIPDSLGYIVLSKGDSSVYVYYAQNKWRKIGNDSAYVNARFDTSARTLTLYRINKDSTVLLIPAGSGSGSGATDYSWIVVGNTVSQLWNNGANHSFDKSDARITNQMVTNLSTIPNGGETLSSVLARGNNANNFISLGSISNTNAYAYNLNRLLMSKAFASQIILTNTGTDGGMFMSVNDGDNARTSTIAIVPASIAPIYSRDNLVTQWKILHQKNVTGSNGITIDSTTNGINISGSGVGGINAGTGINISGTDTVTISNSGVLSLTASSPLSASASTGNISLTHLNSGVTAGSNYTKFSVNSTGHITSASQINSGDVTTALGFTPLNPSAYPVNLGGETFQSVTDRGNTTTNGIFVDGRSSFNSSLNLVDTLYYLKNLVAATTDSILTTTSSGIVRKISISRLGVAVQQNLSSVLSVGNNANNSMSLGSTFNTTAYSYNLNRQIGSTPYASQWVLTNTGSDNGMFLSVNNGVNANTSTIAIIPSGVAPIYSNNNFGTQWKMLRQGNVTGSNGITIDSTANGININGSGTAQSLQSVTNVGNVTTNAVHITGNSNAMTNFTGLQMYWDGTNSVVRSINRTSNIAQILQLSGGNGVDGVTNTLQISNNLTYNTAAGNGRQVWFQDAANMTTSTAIQVTGLGSLPTSGTGAELFYSSGTPASILQSINRSNNFYQPMQLRGGNNTSTSSNILAVTNTLTFNGSEVFNTGNIVRGSGIGGSGLTITANQGLSDVLSNGNTAANNIILGSVASGTQNRFEVDRLLSSQSYGATMQVGTISTVNGGIFRSDNASTSSTTYLIAQPGSGWAQSTNGATLSYLLNQSNVTSTNSFLSIAFASGGMQLTAANQNPFSAPVTVTTSTNVCPTNHWSTYLVNNSSNATMTIGMDCIISGDVINIKKISTGGASVSITLDNGGTIDGVTTYTFSTAQQNIQLTKDGANMKIL